MAAFGGASCSSQARSAKSLSFMSSAMPSRYTAHSAVPAQFRVRNCASELTPPRSIARKRFTLSSSAVDSVPAVSASVSRSIQSPRGEK